LRTRIAAALAACTATLCLALGAQAETAEYRGTVKGENTKAYTVQVAANQTLEVSVKTKSSFVHFNVTPLGAKEAIWKGEVQGGSSFEQKFEKAGVYRVDVFLEEAEAKRGGQASFTLTVTTEP
jgi:hypothetical protein